MATRPGTGRPKKTTIPQTRPIKLERICNETNSLGDLARYAKTNMDLSISTSTISCILRQYSMVSYMALRKPRITPKQRRARVDWCNEHLSWSVQDWSKAIFSDGRNFEECIFDVFALVELVFNGRRSELTQEAVSVCEQHIIVH